MKDKMFEFFKNSLLGNISGEPLCEEYKKEWNKCGDDKAALVKFALRQQCLPYIATACYQGKGLTKDYLKREFADYINGHIVKDCDGVEGFTYAMFVDWDYENNIIAMIDVANIMWTKDTDIVIPQTKATTLYVSNSSDVNIVCDGYNSVRIYIFDDSKVTITDTDENTNITVFKYSDEAKVETGKFCLGKVNEFRKELRL